MGGSTVHTIYNQAKALGDLLAGLLIVLVFVVTKRESALVYSLQPNHALVLITHLGNTWPDVYGYGELSRQIWTPPFLFPPVHIFRNIWTPLKHKNPLYTA